MVTPEPISPLVERKLTDTFSLPSDIEVARSLLAQYGKESSHNEHNRVRLAILKLCGGRLDKLRNALAAAMSDYRDTLAWAEYPESFVSNRFGARERDRKQYLDWLNSSS